MFDYVFTLKLKPNKILPKFQSKTFLKIHEYPSADDFEGKKDFMVFKQRDLL